MRIVDNRWVSPYNPALLLRYNTHFNVQLCNSSTITRYLFKYISKGHDVGRVSLTITNANPGTRDRDYNWDEITHYMNMRALTAPEAAAKIPQVPLWRKSCAVVTLPVHCPDEQLIFLEEGEEHEALIGGDQSKLTAFLKLCDDNFPLNMYYRDVVQEYTWVHKTHEWKAKSRSTDVIGRIQRVQPQGNMERIYVRLPLLHKRGPRSFEDLRTVNGITHDTFKEACLALGILTDDGAYRRCLDKMTEVMLAYNLRKLFARILMFCDVSNPICLWEDYKEKLSADYQHIQATSSRTAAHYPKQMAPASIGKHVESNGKTLHDYRLYLDGDQEELYMAGEALRENIVIPGAAEQPLLNAEEMDALTDTLNPVQKHVFDQIMESVQLGEVAANTNRLFYVDAASCLHNGHTSHSLFGIPLNNLDPTSTSSQRLQTEKAAQLRQCGVILWDEISMTSKLQLNVADLLLKHITGNMDSPMGGNVIVISGDFRQALPIPPRRRGRIHVVENIVRKHDVWQHVNKFGLVTNMRATTGTEEFRNWVLRLGECNPITLPSGISVVSPTGNIPKEHLVRTIDDLIDFVFGRFTSWSGRAILTLTNSSSAAVNNMCLARLTTQQKTYFATTTHVTNEGANTEGAFQPEPEMVQNLQHASLPPNELNLRIGSRVMLLRNLGVGSGLCNGTMMEVFRLFEHAIIVKILTGIRQGAEEHLFRVKLSQEHDFYPITISRYQFAIRLAFSVTINKSQGQSFDKVGIFLDSQVFSHGQLFVAFSRAKRKQGIRLPVPTDVVKPERRSGEITLDNIVYQELFGRVTDRQCQPTNRGTTFQNNIISIVHGGHSHTYCAQSPSRSDTTELSTWSSKQHPLIELCTWSSPLPHRAIHLELSNTSPFRAIHLKLTPTFPHRAISTWSSTTHSLLELSTWSSQNTSLAQIEARKPLHIS